MTTKNQGCILMEKKGVVTIILGLILVLTGCDVYENLYGESEVPIEDINDEVDETLDEILAEDETEETSEIDEEEAMEEEDTEPLIDLEEIDETPVEEQPVEIDSSEDAIVVTVTETELVNLVPEADDPDEDRLLFTFSSPLDENGRWQTNYGDNGEYTITVTASDGDLTTTENVLVIVRKKEEAPTINSFSPAESAITIKETESINFEVDATDLNGDELTYSWKFDGDEVNDGDSYTYQSTYEDSGSHTVKIDITDGVTETNNIWSLTIENVNRKPTLDEIDEIIVKETETVLIEPVARDADGDELRFTISEPVGNDGVWETTYDDSGEHTVTITVSDGEESVSQDVTITVENVNRAPVIRGISQRS